MEQELTQQQIDWLRYDGALQSAEELKTGFTKVMGKFSEENKSCWSKAYWTPFRYEQDGMGPARLWDSVGKTFFHPERRLIDSQRRLRPPIHRLRRLLRPPKQGVNGGSHHNLWKIARKRCFFFARRPIGQCNLVLLIHHR